MDNGLYIPERRAMSILQRDGDFTESQARIVLMHSKRQAYDGKDMYPLTYIADRARNNAAKEN